MAPQIGWATRAGQLLQHRATIAAIAVVAVLTFLVHAEYVTTGLLRHSLGEAFVEDVIHNATYVLAAALCLLGGLRRPRSTSHVLIGLGLMFWTAANIYWMAVVRGDETPPHPSPADALWLAFFPLAYMVLRACHHTASPCALFASRRGGVPEARRLGGREGGRAW